MYRFLIRPRWLAFTALVLAAVVAMINLSIWQVHRLHERQDFNSLVTERSAAAPEAPQPGWLGADADPATAEWRAVRIAGIYEGDGDAIPAVGGYQLVVPFRLADGTRVLVNRGIVPSTEAAPAPPTGDVDLVGRVRRVPTAVRKALDTAGTYVEALESTPADSDSLSPIAAPTLDDGPHLSYAIQWAIFSACAVIGWVLAVRSSARKQSGRERSSTSRRGQAVPWTDEPGAG